MEFFQIEWQCYQLTNSVFDQFYAINRQNQLKKQKVPKTKSFFAKIVAESRPNNTLT
jgi:hypothetical protein